MIDSFSASRLGVIGSLALALAGAPSMAQAKLVLSDTIKISNATCVLTSQKGDVEVPPEFGPQPCKFSISPNGFIRVAVPGSKDEIILCTCTLKPNGTITGTGREGEGPGAYSATITGKTKPGATWANAAAAGIVLQVFELPSLP